MAINFDVHGGREFTNAEPSIMLLVQFLVSVQQDENSDRHEASHYHSKQLELASFHAQKTPLSHTTCSGMI